MSRWKRRAPSGKTEPVGIGSILDGVFARKNAGTAFDAIRHLAELKRRIGEDFACHMKPQKIYDGVLYCLVDSPSWLQQYQFFTPEILRRVNTPPLPEPITSLRFTVGRIDNSEYLYGDAEQEHTRSLTPPTLEEIDTLEKAAAAVNPELRESMRGLIESWLALVQAEEQKKDEV